MAFSKGAKQSNKTKDDVTTRHPVKGNLNTVLETFTKINLKWKIQLECKTQNNTMFRRCKEKNLHGPEYGNSFLNKMLKHEPGRKIDRTLLK